MHYLVFLLPSFLGGWRQVEANGKDELPAEIIVSQEKFTVHPGHEGSFEQYYERQQQQQQQQHNANEIHGNDMIHFNLMRRDATVADDGTNYIAHRMFPTLHSYRQWRKKVNVKDFIKPEDGTFKSALFEGKLTLFSMNGC